MNLIESISLFGIMLALAAIPSASVALVVARSATSGIANGIAVAAGIVLGDLVFIALAIMGLSVVAELLGGFFMLIKILGGLYLLWLGFSLFRSGIGTQIAFSESNSKSSLLASFVAGLLLTLGDVKAIVFYASLFPIFIDLTAVDIPEITLIILITVISVGGVKLMYAVFARKLAKCIENKKMENAARKTVGGLMMGAGGYLIVKN